jgi:predicted  nucleic acid-binding Zn-ribbon protein
METPRDADVVRMKLREDLDKNNGALYVANLENIITNEALKKINVALHVVNMEITELQVDYNTTSALLADTEDDLKDMKADLHDAQTKIDHARSDLMWENFFNGLEVADAKQEAVNARQGAVDAKQEAVDARQDTADIRSRRKSLLTFARREPSARAPHPWLNVVNNSQALFY